MRIARLLSAILALAVLTAAPAAADDSPTLADGSAAQSSELQAQVEANGLSPEQARTLQDQVDQVVASTGGTQVALNQVRWDGGDTLIPLPGETQARELGVAADAAGPHGCNYKQFCLYQYDNYQGMVARMKSCTWHDTRDKYFESYVNNQTRGTRARFYDYNRNLLSYSKPAPDKGTTSLGLYTMWVRPC